MSNYGGNYIDQNQDSYSGSTRQNNPYSGQNPYVAPNTYTTQQPTQYGHQQSQPQYRAPLRPATEDPSHYPSGGEAHVNEYEMEPVTDQYGAVRRLKPALDRAEELSKRFLTLRQKLLNDVQGPTVVDHHELDAITAEFNSHTEALTMEIRKARTQFGPNTTIDTAIWAKFQQLLQNHSKAMRNIVLNEEAKDRKVYMTANNLDPENPDHIREANEAVQSGEARQAFVNAAMGQRRQGASNALANVREREQEIARIAREMQQIAVMSKQLNDMVLEQEPVVEQIAQKAQETEEHMEEGIKELGVGIEKARSARRKKWWCLLIVVVLIIIIIIVIMIVVVKPIIENSNNKRSLEYLAHARRSIIEDLPTRLASSSQARRAMLE